MGTQEEINYVKAVLKSDINLAYIGIMIFLMLVVNFWGFLPLLIVGQIVAAFVAQLERVQKVIRSRMNIENKSKIQEDMTKIVQALPPRYQSDFNSVKALCDEIERRSIELDASSSNTMLNNIVEKLSGFQHEYARMLRAHRLLSTRNYRSLQETLSQEILRFEDSIERETSGQVRQALNQNLNILKQRLARIKRLEELVRLLEARLQVIKNSLGLIQDEVYTFTDVTSISGLVDNLLVNLSVSDEFRSAYEDILNLEDNTSSIEALESELSTSSAAKAARTQQRKQQQHIR
jgi:hypothetical protein